MRTLAIIVAAVVLHSAAFAQPLTTSFTFQGRFDIAGSPASGLLDLRFRLYDAPGAGAQQGPTLCADNVTASNGVVTLQLDFGAQFAGQRRWLEVDVRQDTGLTCASAVGYTTLAPRQELTITPNASFAVAAGTAQSALVANAATSATTAATATNATQLNGQAATFYTNAANLSSGTIPGARLSGSYTNALTLNNASNAFTGSFSGSGAGLTSVPFSSLTGVPATVSLQSATPGAAQTGNLNLTGEGLFSGVAIGTTAPAAAVHVVDPSVGRLRVDAAGGAEILLQAQSTLARIGTHSNSPLNFIIGGNDKMYLTTAGHLGIGTSVPDADLHVFRGSAGTITANVNAPLAVESNTNAYINILAPDASETGVLFGRPGATIPNAAGGIVYNNTANADGLQFRTGGNLTRMTIDSGGNVGIGTANPTARLHVVGTSSDVILPNGSLNASEIADEPGVACDIVNSGDQYSPFSGMHTSATRTINCPTAGFVLAVGTVSLWGDITWDTEVFLGLSTSSSFLSSNQHRHMLLSGKTSTVTVQGLFSAAAGNKTISLLVQPNDTGRTLLSGPAHLTLIFLPTAYGTVDSD